MNYSVKAAARATGVSESRLRTWERRYGIPTPSRSPTGRRQYDDDDLSLIRRMSALIDAGASAVHAAQSVRSGEGLPVATSAVPVEHAAVAEIVRAAEAFDERGLTSAVRESAINLGWAQAIDEVLFPALRQIGAEWELATLPPAKEHFASELVRMELNAGLAALEPSGAASPRVILTCPESERHDLPLTCLHLLLRLAGINCIYLGADVPTVDLLDSYDAVQPDALCLSASSSSGVASLVRTSRLLISRRGMRLYVGGPTFTDEGVDAAGIRLPRSVQAAARRIVADLKK